MSDTLYKSNNGEGPLLARVLAVRDDVALMIRWHEDMPPNYGEGVMFELPAKFIGRPVCGWKPIGDAPDLDPVTKAFAEVWAAKKPAEAIVT